MYNAIFYVDAASYNAAKTATTVLQAHDPFNMVIVNSTAKTPGDFRKVKNTLTFSDLDEIPSNRAILQIDLTQKQNFDDAIVYLKANNITIRKQYYNIGLIVVELPRGTYSSFEDKITGSAIALSSMMESTITPVEPMYAFNYNQHWHLGNIGAECAWNALAPIAENDDDSDCGEQPNFAQDPIDGRTLTLVECCSKPEVALLDVGVQLNHPDLVGRVSGCQGDPDSAVPITQNYNYNCVDGNTNVEPQSSTENHATPLAGIIAGNNLNNNFTLSVSNNYVKVQVLRVMYMVGPTPATTPDILIEGIQRAKNNPKCAAINMSFRTGYTGLNAQMVALALNDARVNGRGGRGIAIFASIGNSPLTVGFPANDINVMAIAASLPTGTKASWSISSESVFLGAPGQNIRTIDRTLANGYSTVTTTDPTVNYDAFYTNLATMNFSGSSVSSAIAASVAGCMVAANPAITVDEITTILADTATQSGGYTYDPTCPELGNGVINMCDAVEAAVTLATTTVVPDITLTIDSSPATLAACNPTASPVTCTVEGTGDIWGQTVFLKFNYYASPTANYLSSAATLLHTVIAPVSGTDTYTASISVSASALAQFVGTTAHLIVTVSPLNSSSQEIGSNEDFWVDSAAMTVTTGTYTCNSTTDLAVAIIGSSCTATGARIYQIRYTNVGSTAITTFNRTYGWVGGTTATNTQTYPGTNSSNGPLLPGQSRIIYISFNSPAPQFPAVYFHRINTVNGSVDGNFANNQAYFTIYS